MKYVAILFSIFGICIRNGMTFKTLFFRANLKSKSKEELKEIGKRIIISGAIITILSGLIYFIFK